MLNDKVKQSLLIFQKNEITEHIVYKRLAEKADGKNADVLKRISDDELKHYNEWKRFTLKDVPPNQLTILKILIVSKILGLTFAIKMMERGERKAEVIYGEILKSLPVAKDVLLEETEHEKLLIDMIDEEKIKYVGSMVLGLNDALVEITGALAGLTFTFQNTRMIDAAGLITGIAASLSMSASEYLSQKSESSRTNPVKASLYTGIAYILTVFLLIVPYFLFENYYFALGITVIDAALVVFVFSFFISVVKEMSFKRMFIEILFISLGIAVISFIIGWLAQSLLHVEV